MIITRTLVIRGTEESHKPIAALGERGLGAVGGSLKTPTGVISWQSLSHVCGAGGMFVEYLKTQHLELVGVWNCNFRRTDLTNNFRRPVFCIMRTITPSPSRIDGRCEVASYVA